MNKIGLYHIHQANTLRNGKTIFVELIKRLSHEKTPLGPLLNICAPYHKNKRYGKLFDRF